MPTIFGTIFIKDILLNDKIIILTSRMIFEARKIFLPKDIIKNMQKKICCLINQGKIATKLFVSIILP